MATLICCIFWSCSKSSLECTFSYSWASLAIKRALAGIHFLSCFCSTGRVMPSRGQHWQLRANTWKTKSLLFSLFQGQSVSGKEGPWGLWHQSGAGTIFDFIDIWFSRIIHKRSRGIRTEMKVNWHLSCFWYGNVQVFTDKLGHSLREVLLISSLLLGPRQKLKWKRSKHFLFRKVLKKIFKKTSPSLCCSNKFSRACVCHLASLLTKHRHYMMVSQYNVCTYSWLHTLKSNRLLIPWLFMWCWSRGFLHLISRCTEEGKSQKRSKCSSIAASIQLFFFLLLLDRCVSAWPWWRPHTKKSWMVLGLCQKLRLWHHMKSQSISRSIGLYCVLQEFLPVLMWFHQQVKVLTYSLKYHKITGMD